MIKISAIDFHDNVGSFLRARWLGLGTTKSTRTWEPTLSWKSIVLTGVASGKKQKPKVVQRLTLPLSITPAERTQMDTEHLECSRFHQRSVSWRREAN